MPYRHRERLEKVWLKEINPADVHVDVYLRVPLDVFIQQGPVL